MSDGGEIVPVWTLATGVTRVSGVDLDGPMTAARLSELRGVLAALAEEPIATLEVHPMPARLDRSKGLPLDAASPLAHHLSLLLSKSGGSPAVEAVKSSETLFRMVVPAKVAAEFGEGVVNSMRSSAVQNGIHSALRDSTRVVAQATFVPVGEAAAATAAGAAGGAGAAAAAAAGGTALTVAAPLVLMAVAVGVSVAAEQQRRQAIEHITELLEELHEANLDIERSELDGCRDAIDKATAVLLDQGKLGVALGLDSAVHAISKALAAAERRLKHWQEALDSIPQVDAVQLEALVKEFPGIDEEGGTFRAHVELAALAVALKRRVIVLQAVDHAQSDPDNQFSSFTRVLKRDQERLDELESGIGEVLVRLSKLELARPRGVRAPVFTAGEVDRLVQAVYRLRSLGDGVEPGARPTDVAIEIARERDGSVLVFPAMPA